MQELACAFLSNLMLVVIQTKLHSASQDVCNADNFESCWSKVIVVAHMQHKPHTCSRHCCQRPTGQRHPTHDAS